MLPSVFTLLHLLLLLCAHSSAFPTPLVLRETSIIPRANGDQTGTPMVVKTTNPVKMPAGPAVEVCTITLTPITGANGEAQVRMEKVCVVTLESKSSSAATSSTSAASTSTTSTSSSVAASTTSQKSSATSTSVSTNVSSSTQSSTATVTSTSSTAAVNSASKSSSTTSSATSTTSTSVPAVPQNAGAAAGGSTSLAPSGTSAADTAATTSAAPFQLPGQKIAVLPIGLGVFAGIALIALIVVGFVTYERTKYRKAFRQRKLAEQGSGMGYGGMAQR